MTNSLEIYHSLPPHLRSVAASLRGYYLRWWRYGPDTEKLIEQTHERETWSPEQWNRWQQERLSFVLDHAVRHVPYYREHWTRRKGHGDRASHAYLENWPVLKKEQLRQFPELFLSDQSDFRKMFRDNTSGSTGTPIYTYLSRKTLHEWFALFEARVRRWNGVTRHDYWGILGGQLVVPNTQKKPPFWVWNAGLNQLYMSSYHLSLTNIPVYIKAIGKYQLKYILGYASSLYSLAQGIIENNIEVPNLKVVFSNAEPLFAFQRSIIEQAFRCPVRDAYGMAEIVGAASECEYGHMHLWPEVGVVEVLEDDADVPVPDRETGRLVCTGLLNVEMPLIRYDTGDRGAIASNGERCACGRQLPILLSIDGRKDDVILTPDGRRIGRLDPVFKASLSIKEAQIIQETLNDICILIVPAKNFTADDSESIIFRTKQRVGQMNVRVELTDEIPRSSNGKFRAVISKLSNANNR